MIKIASKWSGEGGSTESLIGLCNMFNRKGYRTVFYGPQEYHLDKCRGERLVSLDLDETDCFIGHYLELQKHPACRIAVLSCHEKETFPLQHKVVTGYDVVRFVSTSQQSWHRYSGKSVVIPDNVTELKAVKLTTDRSGVAGVIGTILPTKQTHLSVNRALADGMQLVRIYGAIGDHVYFDREVKPLLSDRVVYEGHVPDKQAIYDSVSCVYHSSVSETYGLVKAECYRAGIPFFGTADCDIQIDILTESALFDLWNKLLVLKSDG